MLGVLALLLSSSIAPACDSAFQLTGVTVDAQAVYGLTKDKLRRFDMPL